METVKLKNGATEAKVLVNVTYMNLRQLIKENPIAFFELVTKCRDINHQLFGNTGNILKSLSFVDANGGIHDSIRNIVLSATEGEMLNMKLISPIKEEANEIKETLESTSLNETEKS